METLLFHIVVFKQYLTDRSPVESRGNKTKSKKYCFEPLLLFINVNKNMNIYYTMNVWGIKLFKSVAII